MKHTLVETILLDIQRYWPDEFELAGAGTVEACAKSVAEKKPLEIEYAKGGSDWPILETTAVIVSICELINLVYKTLEHMEKKSINKKQLLEEIKSTLPSELITYLDSEEGKNLIREKIKDHEERS